MKTEMNKIGKAISTLLLAMGTLMATAMFAQGTVTGELKKWHKVTIAFQGPQTSEQDSPNPFTDYRLDVSFTNGTTSYTVPGYYATDGNAAETSATSGNVWLVHFAPDKTGTWTYSASFKTGTNVAQNGGGASAGYFDGATGSFSIGATDKTGRDNRGKGLLKYVNKHHLQFAETGEYFLKQGSDAPENLLAYDDFDNTPDDHGYRKSWSPHVGDWKTGDPTWKGDKGKGLIGAVNYMASKGMNAMSFLTWNYDGDDDNVFPYVDRTQKLVYDVSKLAQWEIVFSHMDKMGIYLHFKTQETENDQSLDGGNLGNERKLYYRELIARFGHHLALNWNIGEENTQTEAQEKACIQYFYDNDPYRHNVVIHTYPGDHNKVYTPLLGSASKLTGTSIQTPWNNTFNATKTWVDNSAAAGKPWVVANDEQGSANDGIKPDANDSHDGTRKETLWGNLMAGGAGNEYYFGYAWANSDMTCQDFRSRDKWWDMCRYALEFFKNNNVPFWDMKNDNGLSSNSADYCLYKAGEVYVLYLKNGGTTNLNLSGVSGAFEVKWFDPRNGGALKNGSVTSVNGGGSVALGNAPDNTNLDWTILVRKSQGTTYNLNIINGSGDGNYPQNSVVQITANSPGSGQAFDKWTGNVANVANVNNASTSVTMPAANISITATYKNVPVGDQSVTSLTLINADTDTDIGPLINGATLNLATLPTRNLNVRANTSPSVVGSVRFAYDSNSNFQTESMAPYALAQDTSGDYRPWTPSVGSHTITATPYSEASGAGTAGTPLTINITVIDQTAPTTYALTVNSGSGDGSYEAETVVNISANAAPAGQEFDKWTGDVASLANANLANTSITMPAAAVTVTATYKDLPVVTLRDPDMPVNGSLTPGLKYEYYTGTWDLLPDFDALTPVTTGNIDTVNVSVKEAEEYYGIRYTGYIVVPEDGDYTFYTNSDDGSQLFIGEEMIVDNDGLHSMREHSGTIGLKAGGHAITVTFFEKTGGDNVIVSYKGPDIAKQVIPASAYQRIDDPQPPVDKLIDANFDADAADFVYLDDTFRNTAAPGYADGSYDTTNGAIKVTLGGQDDATVNGMSGAWVNTFTLAKESEIVLVLNYHLLTWSGYEPDEFGEALVAIDGQLLGENNQDYLVQIHDGGDSGWQTFTATMTLPAGQHIIELGAYNNKKTYHTEVTEVWYDDVSVSAVGQETDKTVFAVNCGGGAYTAADGTEYVADVNFIGGNTWAGNGAAIENTEDDTLYQSERYGNISYNIPVENGIYEVTIKLAEIYWDNIGQRQFDVMIEDQELITDLDLIQQVGKFVPHDKTFTVNVDDGELNIDFLTDINNAKVSAIKVTK